MDAGDAWPQRMVKAVAAEPRIELGQDPHLAAADIVELDLPRPGIEVIGVELRAESEADECQHRRRRKTVAIDRKRIHSQLPPGPGRGPFNEPHRPRACLDRYPSVSSTTPPRFLD